MTTTMNLEYNHIKVEEISQPPPIPNFSKHNFLDLLATVATETLKNDKSLLNIKTRPLSRPLKSYKFDDIKKMTGSTLLRLFAIPDYDEMKKTYRFKCRLLPNECTSVVSSVGNETRAKNQMKNHLLTHIREKRKDFEEKLFLPFTSIINGGQQLEPPPPLYLDSVYLKEHSYSLLSAMGKPPLNNDHDDAPKDTTPEPQRDYSEFLGVDCQSDSSNFMDVDGFITEIGCHNVPQTLVPAVGSEVACIGLSEEDGKSVSEKEKDAATMAIILLQLKGSSTPIEDLICSVCLPPRRFSTYSSLLSHLKGHTGIKAFECQDCSAQFTRQHSLNYHRLIHDNQTRFTCKDCGRKFRHPSHYKEHRRRHTGELPFQCVDCLLRYKTRNTYKRHLRVNHGKILTSLGSVVCLNGPTDENEIRAATSLNPERRNKRLKPPSDGDGGTDSSSSSMTDEDDKGKDDEPLSLTLKFNSVKSSSNDDNKGDGPRQKNSSSPVPNFVSDPPLGAITPKKKISSAMVSNGVTISKYSDHHSSNNIENKNIKSFRPSSKSAFKTPGDIYKRVRNNVEIRKLVCFDPEYAKGGSSSSSSSSKTSSQSSQTSKVKILKESVETNNKTSAILAEIDGKRVLLIPKNEQVVGSPSPVVVDKPKSKLEECLLYGVQRAKNSV